MNSTAINAAARPAGPLAAETPDLNDGQHRRFDGGICTGVLLARR